ncbi:6-bladed beta-propeller [uncultured Cyclobacterium sp.]|uniref:6-bladed beta-propeller n=1 Tax=uncultured Cyclobacterium sp. TaxID=453820 RepID=UPI0030EEA18A|tara:strand:- start:1437 stop:2606 length:1170 start_codon:yes stop_codon:yes gene_type:complete
MKKAFFIAFSAFLLNVSCKESVKKEIATGPMELTIAMEDIQPAYAFSKFDLVPLELNDLSLVGAIDKLIVEKDKLFILDKEVTKSVFCFSTAGKFLFKINNIGEGDGKFSKPFDLNLFNESLQILDIIQKKILVFDLEGNYKHEKPVPFEEQVVNFFPINQDFTAYHMDGRSFGSEETDFIRVLGNKDSTISIQGVSDIGSTDAYQVPIEFSQHDGNVRFLHAWTDTIYNISEKGIEADYILNFGADRLDKKVKKLPLMDMRKFIMGNPYVFNAANLVENEEYLSFQWTRSVAGYANSEDQTYVSYYRKSTEKLDHFPLLENWVEKVNLQGPLYGAGEWFFGYLNYEDWNKLSAESKDDLIIQNSNVNAEYLDAGNPIIVKYRLKEGYK